MSHDRQPLPPPAGGDEAILNLYYARDERAITETDRRFGRACLRVAMSILQSAPDAEECVSDAYLKTWNSIPPARPRSLGAYVCRIVRNLSLNRLRELTAPKRSRDLTVSFEELEACIPVREELEGELSAILSDFLRALPDRERRLFLGRYWYTVPVKELAREWSMTPNAVTLSLRRTREKLRTYLTERGYTV